MKGLFLINVLLMATVINGCTASKSVAAKYKEDKAKQASGDATGADPEEGEPSEGEPGEGEPDGETGGGGEGDIEAGLELINNTCTGCHNDSNKVKLDKNAVSRLDEAYTGAQAPTHSNFSAAFEAGRADLEAALNSIEPE